MKTDLHSLDFVVSDDSSTGSCEIVSY